MQYNNFYISNKDGKSNCVIRSFCKLFSEDYDKVYEELCCIAKELNCDSYNDIEVFETYMKRRDTLPFEYGEDMIVKNLIWIMVIMLYFVGIKMIFIICYHLYFQRLPKNHLLNIYLSFIF